MWGGDTRSAFKDQIQREKALKKALESIFFVIGIAQSCTNA
jgi:hypothetical protein